MTCISYQIFFSCRLRWFLLLSVFGGLPLSAQEDDSSKLNLIYVEALGAGAYYSINYARHFLQSNRYHLNGRIGFSSYHFRDFTNSINPDIIIPVGLHFQYGAQHLLEIGLGHTFASLVKTGGTSFKPEREMNHHGYFLLGYRYNKSKSRWSFGFAYAPILERYSNYRHWLSITSGYRF